MSNDARRLEFDKRPRKRRMEPACRKKVRYTDETQARAGAMMSLEEHGGAKLWVYRCLSCFGWHLTSSHHGRKWMVTVENPVAA